MTGTDVELFGSVFVWMQQLTVAVDERLKDFGLTSRQWLLLGVLDRAFSGYAPTISEATTVFGTSRQNVKQVALQLERKGWLRLVPDPSDGRVLRLELTDRLAVFQDPDVQADHAAFVLGVFGGLSQRERKSLLQMVSKCIACLSSPLLDAAPNRRELP